MIYGPFDLSDADAAELSFMYWLDSEPDNDKFSWGASKNGSAFYIYSVSGYTNGWQEMVMDLSDVHTIGNLLGEPQVWIAFLFRSDAGVGGPEGTYVDEDQVRKLISATMKNKINLSIIQRNN